MLDRADVNELLLDPSLGSMNLLNGLREQYPRAISFAAGRPFDGYFRVEDALERLRRSRSARELDALAQYGATEGVIQSDLATLLANDEGLTVAPESIIVTVGCQEALALCVIGLCRPGRDAILVGDPTYVGITGLATMLGIDLAPVRTGPEGLDLDDLRAQTKALRAAGLRPRLIYDVPDFANPTGTSMPLAGRRTLLEIAAAEDLLILEDQAYRAFGYDAPPPPALKALDRDGRVILLGTFAKTLFPGARVGYLVADQQVATAPGRTEPLAALLSRVKSFLTVNTAPICQALLAAVLRAEGGSLRAYNREAAAFYRRNRDAMLAGLAAALPAAAARGIHWNRPAGGFFVTLTLPFPADDQLLRRSASDYGVLWMPMRHFSVRDAGRDQMRLSFSSVTPDEINAGTGRLGRLIEHRWEEVCK